jgi:hypothetical protein
MSIIMTLASLSLIVMICCIIIYNSINRIYKTKVAVASHYIDTIDACTLIIGFINLGIFTVSMYKILFP